MTLAQWGINTTIRDFMNSEVAEHLDSPYNKLQWMGEEYLIDELKDEKMLGTDGERYSPEVLYWIGYLYRYWIVENPGNRIKQRWIKLITQTEITCETREQEVK